MNFALFVHRAFDGWRSKYALPHDIAIPNTLRPVLDGIVHRELERAQRGPDLGK